MGQFLIGGIQQLGVGVAHLRDSFKWYRRHFGVDIPVFDDDGVADLMLPYTGGQPQRRHAILAANMQGGSAFEIWQYKSREPQAPRSPVRVGDLGIFCSRIKARKPEIARDYLISLGADVLGELHKDPAGADVFFVRDSGGLVHQIVSGEEWFRTSGHPTGGVAGCQIGVTDIDRARALYSDILGYDTVLYDVSGEFPEWHLLPGGDGEFRRVLLGHAAERRGPFSRWLGRSQIELVQVSSRTPKKMFEGRFWGDLGFIHLCFDVTGMEALKRSCQAAGFPFTVDSASSFDMGQAAGRFSYLEDPDGTLVEFVETHKVPIHKGLGWYVDLRKRAPGKALPNWMVKTMAWGRVKD